MASSSSSSSATDSGTPSVMRKRKRKGNIVSVEKEDDTMEAIQARVKAARKKKHKPATVSDNIKRVVAIITWLVLKSLTQARQVVLLTAMYFPWVTIYRHVPFLLH